MRRGSPYHQGFGNGDAHITVTLGNNRLSLQPRPFATLETVERNWTVSFHKEFWDRHSGRTDHLLVNPIFFPSLSNNPSSFCGSLLGLVAHQDTRVGELCIGQEGRHFFA